MKKISSNDSYDKRGLTTQIQHQNAAGTPEVTFAYERDVAGQISKWTHHGESVVLAYDQTDQLTAADYSSRDDETYSYNELGNRTNGGEVIAANNRLEEDNQFAYQYKHEGNLVLKTSKLDGSVWEYRYDNRQCLIKAIKN